MNRIAFNNAMRLLSRFIQEYNIDVMDPKFNEYERDLLRIAINEAEFYGHKFGRIDKEREASISTGEVRKPGRPPKGF